MLAEHLILELLTDAVAEAIIRTSAASVRWAQLRRKVCGGCRSTFWILATQRVEATTNSIRPLTPERDAERKAMSVTIEKARRQYESRTEAMVSCPHCGWVPPIVAAQAWGRAAFVGTAPAVVFAMVWLGVVFAMPLGPDATLAAFTVPCAIAWFAAAWIARQRICRLPWGLAMPRYPTAPPEWVDRQRAQCHGLLWTVEEAWLREEGLTDAHDKVVVASPIDD